jgi:hypothetical protein
LPLEKRGAVIPGTFGFLDSGVIRAGIGEFVNHPIRAGSRGIGQLVQANIIRGRIVGVVTDILRLE